MKMIPRAFLPALGLALCFAMGCTIDDEDRCPKGYEYKEITLSCHPLPTDEETPDTGSHDDQPTDSASDLPDGPPSGLGESCAGDTEACADAGYQANYCVVNPIEQDKAYCSSRDCVADSCEDGYRCCDCSNSKVLPQLSACLKDADADLAGSAIGGCQC